MAPRELLDRIQDRSALIGVVGLGYVGLPVATTFASAGFRVGVDTATGRVAAIEQGRAGVDVDNETIRSLRRDDRLTLTWAGATTRGILPG